MTAGSLRSVSARRTGLTSDEAAARLRTFGPNTVEEVRRRPAWKRFVGQLRDPMMVVLLIAMVLTISTNDLADAVIIAFIVVVNSGVGVLQEIRADNAIAALSAMSALDARVVRDGRESSISADELVPGDLVVVAEGDVVPADGDVLESAALLVDEALLTGESVPVDKASSVDRASSTHPEVSGDALAAGTVVVRGRGLFEVTRTGADSAMGRIAALLVAPPGLTPLQRRLVGLGRLLAAVIAVLCVVVMVLGLVRGQPLELMVLTAISLVVAAVPESLPAVVTLSLALGARRMAARHAIVRRLPAVETLGSVTIIATDKTGTLTEGRMVAEWLWTPEGTASVSGVGYRPEGVVTGDRGPVTATNAPQIVELLRAAVLCNDAVLQPPTADDGDWSATGDPTEAALLAAAGKAGIHRSQLEREAPRIGELPFDSNRKRMTTVHQLPGDGVLVVCKGAPEVLLHEGVGEGAFLDEPVERLAVAAAHAEAFARDGYRVLTLASARLDHRPAAQDDWEGGLRLLGLVAIADPPRPAAAATIASCKAAGITMALITGDHVATANAVAARLGIPADQVYARTTPEQKLELIRRWQQAGHVVAMTGDGVNDAPAMNRADIGVAMGRRGTEVARQAADMVLADDDLATVVAAVEEGRRVYANVRRFLLYGLSGGLAEILVMLVGPALGMPLPLLPAQILWVNLMTHGLPGVAIGAEPSDPGSMSVPPRPPAESVIGRGLWHRIARLSLVVATTTLGVGAWAHHTGRPWQSMVFLTLATAQLGIAFGVRARPGTWENPFLILAASGAFLLTLAALYLPFLRDLLETVALTGPEVAAVSLVSMIGYLAARVEMRLQARAG